MSRLVNEDGWSAILRELAVYVDGVKARDEVDEDVVDTLWHLLEERSSYLLVGWILREVDRDEELLGLGINVANVDSAFVGEENPVALCGSGQPNCA